jgi:5-hydroxyisourate hydrolase-like protein (transthyretin family)
LAKRFVYNAIKKNRLMKESINRIIKYLTSIEIAKESREHQVIFHLIRNEFNLNLQYAKEINVLVSDIQGRVQIEENLVKEDGDLKRYLINRNEIDTGDILFRYKVKGHFKENLISRIISTVTSSQITHVLMAAKVSPSDVRIIDAHMEQGSAGVHLRDFKILPGEILIVLRPRIGHFQIKLLLKKIVECVKVKSGFSDLKLVGVFISYLISKIINIFKSGYALVPNFIRTRRSKYFCSELVNQAFREAGILLTPKSQYSGIVFPSDIIVSPYLDFIGLIFKDFVKSEAIVNTCFSHAQI